VACLLVLTHKKAWLAARPDLSVVFA
jgi:hypothetical protein